MIKLTMQNGEIQDKKNVTVFVGMSGGVDSSVSALLLKQQGYNVVGVYMKNWSGDTYGIQTDCPWIKDTEDVENVCKQIGITFRSFNFEKEYREKVVDYFFSEYKKGRTPNPDVMCNKEIKFDLFLKKSLEEGADMIATGHYAQIEKDKETGEYKLLKGIDNNKDQSYFLCTLNQYQLSKTIFPIGHLIKPDVRKIAKENNLVVAEKKDSQGICFIGKIDVNEFLKTQIQTKEGDIVNEDTNKVIGKHQGVYFYTIGQREGINIGGTKLPLFVSRKDFKNNILYVVEGTSNPKLFKSEFELESITFTDQKEHIFPIKTEVSIRYRQKPFECEISNEGNKIEVKLGSPIRAVSSGQIAVFYNKEELIAWGVIL
ncbi:MAG: tRNA 2-thiouridine(34) synthase MnmA [bacterium]